MMIPPQAGPLPGTLEWAATVLEQIRAESGRPAPRYRVRFAPVLATLECLDHDEPWLVDRVPEHPQARGGRPWYACMDQLASTFGFSAQRHDAVCHPPMGPITRATDPNVITAPAWWGRRFA